MTITIHMPELEALIQERLNSGAIRERRRCAHTGAEIFATGAAAARCDRAAASR
jgi:hypothetical protein